MRWPLLDFTKSSARSDHYLAIGCLVPVLLKGRLPHDFLRCFVHLKWILSSMAELEIGESDMRSLELSIYLFQKEFYSNWYSGLCDRVKVCHTYFHALWHIPDAN